MAGGAVAEDGPFDDLMARDGAFAALYRSMKDVDPVGGLTPSFVC